MKPILRTALVALGVTVGACNKSDATPAAAVPPPPALPTAAQPASQPAMAASQPAAAASQPAAAASQPAAQGAPFSGEVRLADGVGADLIKPTDVLFLMARECMGDCTKPGRLVAVQRLEKLKLPVPYTMGPEHVMMAGTPFTGPFLVQARVDRDGDAMTKGPDDLYAEVTTGVTPGQAGVVLAVGKLATPPAPAPAH